MKKFILILFFSTLFMSGCSSMHDGAGWEHKGDAKTHSDSTPYLFEHKHD